MKAFIFDLDGTLLDTLADIAWACNAVLAEMGYPQHPVEAYRKMVGNGFENLARRALPQERMPDICGIEEITSRMRSRYADNMMLHTIPYPGMEQTLAKLALEKMPLAVLSNKPDALTRTLITHYFPAIHFTVVQGALQDAPLKPDPGALLKIINACSASITDAAYVGDSNVDMETAANAGAKGIGAAWGFRGAEELEASRAWKIIEEPKELLSLAFQKA